VTQWLIRTACHEMKQTAAPGCGQFRA
jgi:hypothetical protein